MNITEDGFKKYLECFHKTLEQTAKDFLPTDIEKQIINLSYLPAKIIGYISTQFGIGFEYSSCDKTIIEIKRGSARIEDLLLKAPKVIRKATPVFQVNGHLKLMGGARFTDRFPFRLGEINSSIVVKKIQFYCDRDVRIIEYAELHGNRTSDNWYCEQAIERAKNIILAALVDLNQARLKQVPIEMYIENYKEKTVLLLGDYDQNGIKRLEIIKKELIKFGYLALMIKDIPDHPQHNLDQKVVAIGSISRFIVIDDSSRSGHIKELHHCQINNWVTIILRAHGKGGSYMTAGLANYSNVIIEKPYEPQYPEETIKECINWAELKLKELENELFKTYPWRTDQ